jgi:hypothetical protein
MGELLQNNMAFMRPTKYLCDRYTIGDALRVHRYRNNKMWLKIENNLLQL